MQITRLLISILLIAAALLVVPAQVRTGGKITSTGRVSATAAGGGGGAGDPFAITVGISDATGVYVPDNYTSGFTPPAKCNAYVDSKTGVTIKRLTNGWADIPNSGLTGEYSQRTHLNVNNTRLLVQDAIGGTFYVVNPATCAITHTTPIAGTGEPMWDNQNPDIIWFDDGASGPARLWKYDCATSTPTVVVNFNGTGGFPSYGNIFKGGSDDISEDNDHIAILGDGRHAGVYKISTHEFTPSPRDFGTLEDVGQVSVTYDNNVLVGFNTLYTLTGTLSITSGTNTVTGVGTLFNTETRQGSVIYLSTMTGGTKFYVVSNVASNTSLTFESNATGTVSGVTGSYRRRFVLYDKNMNYIRVISKFSGHNTWGRDPVTGDEVFLISAANDEEAGGCASSGILKYLMKNSSKSCFLSYPNFNLTEHASFTNARGSPWVAFTIYDGVVTDSLSTVVVNSILRSDWADAAVWKKFYNEALIVHINTGEVRRLAHTRVRRTGQQPPHYWFTTRGAISKDASYLTFSSSMHSFQHRTGAGTVSTTNGSATVTGVGTSFTIQTTTGGEITIGGVTKFVAAVASNTSLTTTTTWGATQSGVAYTAWHPDIVDTYRIALRAEATDFTAPTISATAAGSITSNSATITWTTNEAATSQVEWGTTTYYGGGISTFSPTKVTSHSVNLTGLPSGTVIRYRVKSRDAAGNMKLDSDRTFTTL